MIDFNVFEVTRKKIEKILFQIDWIEMFNKNLKQRTAHRCLFSSTLGTHFDIAMLSALNYLLLYSFREHLTFKEKVLISFHVENINLFRALKEAPSRNSIFTWSFELAKIWHSVSIKFHWNDLYKE